MEDENKIFIAASAGAGFIVGANWDKVQKIASSITSKTSAVASGCYTGLAKFFAFGKEHVQDMVAEVRVSKAK